MAAGVLVHRSAGQRQGVNAHGLRGVGYSFDRAAGSVRCVYVGVEGGRCAVTRVVKPMLAASLEAEDLQKLKYPVLVSPKVDGIRALVVGGVVQSRSGKPIPCPTVQRLLGCASLEGLDGELTVGPTTSPDLMQRTMAVTRKAELSAEELDRLSFNVFDSVAEAGLPYKTRLSRAGACVARAEHGRLLVLPHSEVSSYEELLVAEASCLAEGFEGLMINNPEAPYKFGRSGKKDWSLLKVKRFQDDEAIVVGAYELQHNENPAYLNELGLTKHSTAKEGLRPGGVLGSLRLRALTGRFEGVEFDCSGFTAEGRARLWQLHILGGLVGRVGTFKHFQVTGAKDRPRQPVWKGFRAAEDR